MYIKVLFHLQVSNAIARILRPSLILIPTVRRRQLFMRRRSHDRMECTEKHPRIVIIIIMVGRGLLLNLIQMNFDNF